MDAATEIDPFAIWRVAVETRKPVNVPRGVVACGYYRARDGECIAFLPGDSGVTVWRSSDKFIPKHADAIVEAFSWVSMSPVSYEDVTAFGETGRWPDEIAPVEVAADLPPHERADAELTAQREAMAKWIAEIGKIATQEQATKAGNYADEFAKIEATAKATHKIEKQPHLDAGRAVDAAWKPVIDRADELKRWAKKQTEAFLIAEKARLKAEDDARREAAAKAVREAEEARRQAEAIGAPPPVDLPDVFNPAPPPAKAKAGKVHLRSVTKHEIVDMRATLEHLARMNQHPAELVAAVQIVVNRMRNAGVEVPGVETKTVEVAA